MADIHKHGAELGIHLVLGPLKIGIVLTVGLYPTWKDPMNQWIQK